MELTLRLAQNKKSSEKSSEKSSGKSSEKIVQAMRDNSHVTAAELAIMIGVSERAIWKSIAKLKAAGVILRQGSDVDGEWVVLK